MGKHRLHTYRLKFADELGPRREIEFEAAAPDAALRMTHRLCGHREVQLYEDGARLVGLKLSPTGDFWMVNPSAREEHVLPRRPADR